MLRQVTCRSNVNAWVRQKPRIDRRVRVQDRGGSATGVFVRESEIIRTGPAVP